MKHSVVCFIGILNVCFVAFPMEKDLIKWFQSKEKMAQESESKKTLSSDIMALIYYSDLIKQIIPISSETADPYKEARDIQKRAYDKIVKGAQNLEQEGYYSTALDLYKNAPNVFKDDIARLEKREKKEKEEIAKNVKIAEEIIKYDEQAEKEKNQSLKLELYGKILKLRLNCAPKSSDSCSKAISIQTNAKYKMLDEADKLKRKKKYDETLAMYKSAGDVFAEDIKKLQKLMDILPELEKLTDPKEYEQAYKKLDELEAQGIDEAKMLKIKIQKQEAEKLRETPEERARLKQLAREKLEREQLAGKSLQEPLKKTLIQLTEKLRTLANYITSHAPL